ncbi:hypothetical protein P43SY_005223 [Pythium insidiosum]|uniref:Hexose transporter 1 n=1 Tax=Pythium insidiosum TaxID=114742 RepID=A0AAD5M9G8_PYTIN|nr:hypothetical protein P43SY_005223 [Pythium insidiosum]
MSNVSSPAREATESGHQRVTPDADFVQFLSPRTKSTIDDGGCSVDSSFQFADVPVQPVLYSSLLLMLTNAVQVGWAATQLNLSAFHDKKECDARPVAPGTCLMFPGHTASEWTWAVNVLFVSGMFSCLLTGRLADHFGRKRLAMMNAVVAIAGCAIQGAAPSISVYIVGRLVSGISSGISTTLPHSYINEISPPHLRDLLGSMYQVALSGGILLVTATFFVADTATGWRYISAAPMGFAAICLVGGLTGGMVESPVWLLTKGRRDDAEREIGRLFGAENATYILAYAESRSDEASALENQQSSGLSTSSDSETQSATAESPSALQALVSPAYRRQATLAVALAMIQQLSGINAVFLYSSSMFTDAGLSDARVGSLVVNIVNFLPALYAGAAGSRFGIRRVMIAGTAVMMLCAGGVTLSLLVDVAPMSIAFMALYVAAYAVSLGPLVYVVVAAIFPDELRATGTSVCLTANWMSTLLVGIGYPMVADALGDLGFLPFIIILGLSALYMAHSLPETSGKTSDEIEALFHPKTVENDIASR